MLKHLASLPGLILILALFSGVALGARSELQGARRMLIPCGLRVLSVRRVVLYPERGAPRGDVLYLHGFGDRADNHLRLYRAWTKAGFRVIAFDLPSHGETQGLSIDFFRFRDLGRLVLAVEKDTRESPDRPLILAGWSTGGLLAVRMIQMDLFQGWARKPQGMILYAPGIAVRALVGEWGVVTERTLTSNPHPPHMGPPSPPSPFLRPVFATNLLLNSWLSRLDPYPAHLPTLVFLGGEDEDRYVRTGRVGRWADELIVNGANLWVAPFPGARHELDNEPGEVGEKVRGLSSQFAEAVTGGNPRTDFGVPRILY